MNQVMTDTNSARPRSLIIWRLLQVLVWIVGLAIFLALIFYPAIGLLVFWNILIPVAPALLVVATGVWRNICPLSTTNLLPRHLGLSQKRKLSVTTQSKLQLVAIFLLYAIVPLRHLLFNNNALATAILLFALSAIGFAMSFIFDWKSAWCSTLCPVHAVEKLYGGNTLISVPNAHCIECVNCSVPCPDSTPNFHPALVTKNKYQALGSILIIGGLPGFIWGWFHVPDLRAQIQLIDIFDVYQLPIAGFAVSILAYLILQKYFQGKKERLLVSFFAATGVSFYYWYRIPALLGFGKFAQDAVLVNLRQTLPGWSILVMTITTTIFFFSWFLLRKPNQRSWLIRPQFAAKA